MGILHLARVPAPTIGPEATVTESILLMKRENVGIVFAVDTNGLVGCLSERDVVFRVALRRRDPDTTRVAEVMTVPAWSLPEDTTVGDSIRLMVLKRVRRLPIVGTDNVVKGMVSLRHMLREQERELNDRMDTLLAEFSADGIGG